MIRYITTITRHFPFLFEAMTFSDYLSMPVHSNNFRSPISKSINGNHHNLGEQTGPTLTTFTDYCTNFEYLLLHDHTLCEQGSSLGVCVSMFFFFFFLVGPMKKKNSGRVTYGGSYGGPTIP